jgi:ubiquitin-protein ligase
MSSKRLKRIINEIKELKDSEKILEESGIYFYYNEDNISILYAMLYGQHKTPYEKGFYFFKIEYPSNYPMEPPIVKYYTQGYLKNPFSNTTFNVRFNPNLYTCGKVCLSMLNTWAGPGWVPTNTVSNVLIAIQAIVLNENPLINEPGFEYANESVINKYSELILYANIKISVLEMIMNTPIDFKFFNGKMKELFIKNIEYYREMVNKNDEKFKGSLIESPAYGMKCNIDYESLLYTINKLEENISSIKL